LAPRSSSASPLLADLAPPTTAAGIEAGVPAPPPGGEGTGTWKSAGPTEGGADDGSIQGRVTVFDDEVAGVTRLDPALLAALRRAATDAAGDGLQVLVNSGWRSPAYQERLLQEAVAKYGSEAAAARWVATPETSPHVSGDAVDVGPPAAARWLGDHGARYGLCRTYRNEAWHFELRPAAVADGCPRPYADPTQDPRMHG
jgi:hypothetical protein